MASRFFLLLVSRDLKALFVFSGLFGITYGEILCAMPLLPPETFGLRHHDALLGIITFASTAGGSVGPPAAAFLFDHFRDCDVVWAVCAALFLVAFVLYTLTGKGRRTGTRAVHQGGF